METNQTKDGQILLMVSVKWSLLRIDMSIIITVIAMLLLMVFGYLRRRIHVTWQKYIIQASYVVTSSALPYFIGLMTNAPVKLEYFPIWAGFLLLAWGSDGYMTVCSLRELELQALHAWRVFVLSFWFGWLAGMYIHDKKINVPLLALYVLIFTKPGEKLDAIAAASRSNGLVKLARPILDHMKGGKNHDINEDGVHDDADPSSMRGYQYLVEVHDCSNTVITIDSIWSCQRGILSSTTAASDPRDHGALLKDICLSFALFKLLLRRFVGFTLHESSKQRTWKFVRDGLLSGSASLKSDGYERAFRVIEIELGFLHDLFFTTSYVVAYQRGYKRKLLQFSCIAICLWFVIFTLADEGNRPKDLVPGFSGIKYNGHNVEVGITRVAIALTALFEIIQLCMEFLSNWKIVRLVCGICVTDERRHWTIKDKMIRFILRMKLDVFPSNDLFCFRPWQRKLGQYSLLHSYDYTLCGRSCYEYWFGPFMQVTRNGQKESPAIVLSKDVKITIIESLLENGPRLQNGKSALQRHGLTNLLVQACDFDYLAQTILVWHVATTMCEHLPYANRSSANNLKQDLHVATSLSKYCAYLVTFAPELLPDNQYLTECQFDTMVEEARREFQGCTTVKNKCQKLWTTDFENNIADFNLKYAGLLGTRLIGYINQDPDRGWKFLKEFWAELLLFSALSSDNATAHGDHLATGGEFITHLWCLLTHAGIINKDSFAP